MSSYDQFFKQAKKSSSGVSVTKKQTPQRPVSSQELATALKEQLKPKLQKKKSKSKKISWKLAGTSFVGFLIAGLGLHYADHIDSFIKRIEFQFIGTALAEQQPTAPVADAKPAAATPDSATTNKTESAVKTSYTEEEINHLSKLNDRKRELDAREEELARLEKEVNQQRENLEKRIADLEKTRRDIASILDDRVQADEQKVETLVQVYSSMKPQQAATIIEDMDEALAVDVLGRMKKKNAAEIMNFFKPEKARVLSEKYAGYRKK